MVDIDQLAISTIRLLSVDQVAHANAGHPGAPLGLAPAAHVVFKKMKFTPKDPHWINKDRFVLSNGHACALLYSMLYLYGYDYTIEDLKGFRSINSKTPGHPERLHCPGVEVTTGPLGQGISNAVGLAIAGKQFAATYNKPDYPISNSYVYCFLGDGCLQEGISSEACSLAGHLKLCNLIAFWDDNLISIDGATEVSFTEDVLMRYRAYGWNILEVLNGDEDLEAIEDAINKAQKSDKPTLIRLRTTIGWGSLLQGTHGVHGAPLKPADVQQLKAKLGFDPEKSFVVPEEVISEYKKHVVENTKIYNEWQHLYQKYVDEVKEGPELARRLKGELPKDWEKLIPTYTSEDKKLATRQCSGNVLDAVFDSIPELIGGSADLTPSNNTRTTGVEDFQPPSSKIGNYSGRYIRYGVREHGMGAIMNGISAFGANFKPYSGTFLNFVSYASGAVRLSAISHHPVIWVATHDSIGLGEDGPTHQPVETLAHFRAIPNLSVWRPADGNETGASYISAINSTDTPHIIALSRQGLSQLKGSSIEGASKGGYIIEDSDKPDLIFVSTGSEVEIVIESAKQLTSKGYKVRVVSMPSCDVFDKQSSQYKLSVLPDGPPILSVEVLSPSGWSAYSHQQYGLKRFGASGKLDDIYKEVGFTADVIADKGLKTIKYYKGKELMSPLHDAF